MFIERLITQPSIGAQIVLKDGLMAGFQIRIYTLS
jgi:hypothetical protein